MFNSKQFIFLAIAIQFLLLRTKEKLISHMYLSEKSKTILLTTLFNVKNWTLLLDASKLTTWFLVVFFLHHSMAHSRWWKFNFEISNERKWMKNKKKLLLQLLKYCDEKKTTVHLIIITINRPKKNVVYVGCTYNFVHVELM